jgi:hypothetical protein
MKKYLLIFSFIPVLAFSQTFQWATSCGKGLWNDIGYLTINNVHELFLTGTFTGPAGIFGSDTLQMSPGNYPTYLNTMLSKLNSSGEFQWTKGILLENDPCSPLGNQLSLPFHNSNNVLWFVNLCGEFSLDTFHFSVPQYSCLFSCIDPDGNFLWARIPGQINVSQASMNVLDQFIIAGGAADTLFLDGHQVLPGGFTAGFNSDGQCIWAKNRHGTNFAKESMDILSDNSIIILGYSLGNVIVVESDTLYSSSEYGGDVVLIKYDSQGNYLWSLLDGGSGVVMEPLVVNATGQGNFYICGSQGSDTLFFGTLVLPNGEEWQQFVVKYDSNGEAIWARNSQSDCVRSSPNDLDIGNDGNIYITGSLHSCGISDTIRFGDHWLFVTNQNPTVDSYYAVAYDSVGNSLGVIQAPNSIGNSIVADGSGNCIIAGQFELTVNFGNNQLTSAGLKDIFVAKAGVFTGTEEQKITSNSTLLIYANPTTGKCNITIPDEFIHEDHLTLSIYDSQGKLIQTTAIERTEETYHLNIRAQAAGVYQAVLTNGKKSYSGKIVFTGN